MTLQFNQALSHLIAEAQEGNKEQHSLIGAVGEMRIDGVDYQIQVQLVADKRMWTGENDVRRSEIVKVHE